ncbi:MAG: hypothetical protein U1E49_03495 [Hyphomicrobiaceae bacterium]
MGKLSRVWVALIGLGLSSAPAGADGTWSMLEGRWSGMGTIALESGATERLKCQATYLVEAEGHVAQRLTCISSSYRIEGSADLIFEGEQLSGTWSESSYAVGGGLAGSAGAGHIAFRLDAPTFTGNASIEVQRCRQTVRVTLAGTIIKSLDAGLRRC